LATTTTAGQRTPPQAAVGGGRSVELLCFNSGEPATVILIAEDGHHLTLQVIDPETNEQRAQQALEEIPRRAVVAARGAPTARSVADIAKQLAGHEGRNSVHRDAEILRWCHGVGSQPDAARAAPTQAPVVPERRIGVLHRAEPAIATARAPRTLMVLEFIPLRFRPARRR
jgi:hypothetical protein